MPESSSTTSHFTPTSLTARAIAPDLARGIMLLAIAIANAPWNLWGASTRMLSTHPIEASTLDRVVQTISLIAIDGRSYPMFAFLFGYGIWQLYSRQMASGIDRKVARRLLRKRHWWMLAFGAVHAALLWAGDIVGAYGLAGLVLVWLFLDRRDKTLRVWAIVLTSVMAFFGLFAVLGGIMTNIFAADEVEQVPFDLPLGIANPNYLLSIPERLLSWLALTPLQGLVGVVVPIAILVAIIAARHRVLEEPGNHLPLLRRTAVVGISIGWLGGAVVAAQNLDLWGIPASIDWAFTGLGTITGLFAGLGYVAVFGLIAHRMSGRPVGRVAYSLQAVGKRSLSSYIAQSVLFAPILSAWGFGLGAHLSSWSVTLFAIGVWLITVVIAVLLERAGKRGPLEWALRMLAYPR